MKTFTLTFLVILLTAPNFCWARCSTNTVSVFNSGGFGMSVGAGGGNSGSNNQQTTNVPFTINNEPACFKKTNAFEMKAESDPSDGVIKGKIIITPLKADFENVPNPHLKQYIYAEKNIETKKTTFHTMSFICSGEVPLSIETQSDDYEKIAATIKDAQVKTSIYIAMGTPAENLNKQKKIAEKNQPTFDFFTKLYKEKTNKELAEMPCCNQKMPSILTMSSVNAITDVAQKAMSSSFTTLGEKIPNGCSTDFATSMKNYLLEDYESNESLKNYKISKKWFSDSLIFEWKD